MVRLLDIESTDTLKATLLDILAEFRQLPPAHVFPTRLAQDGRHRLVRVKGRGLTLEARPGYLAGS